MGGLRGEFKTPVRWLRPYAQLSLGYMRSNAAETNPANYQNFIQVEGFAGADIPLASWMDFRAIELGAGAAFGPSTHSIQSIGMGVVFHTAR
jgi:hypothetical protein